MVLPSGKRYKKLWKITMLLMGKSTISMAIFNSYVCLPEGIAIDSHCILIIEKYLQYNDG